MSDNSNYIQEANKNADKLESAIRELSNIEINSADQFKQYKESSQKVIEMFKTLKPLLKESRESLWKEFNTISNEIRRKQEKKKEDRINSSKRKKDIVISTIREAGNYATGDMNSLKKADDLLKTAHERMKPGWVEGFRSTESLFHLSDGKMTKEDLELCWQLWNEIKEKIKFRRQDISKDNYNTAMHELNNISNLATYGDPYEALKNIKITRSKVISSYLTHEDKNRILNSLNEYWEKANERIKQRKVEREKKQKEWEQRKAEQEKKQREWEQRKVEREKKQREWEQRKNEREKKQREWELRNAERQRERERKQREWEQKKIEYERRQQEREERKREWERKQREWEEIKLERERERERRKQEWEERKNNRSGGRKKSSCYITTATCISLGKPDDCVELVSIRSFRDNWLIHQKKGLEIIENYYNLAPVILNSINNSRNPKIIYQNIWNNYLKEFFELIASRKNKSALKIFLKMITELGTQYLNK